MTIDQAIELTLQKDCYNNSKKEELKTQIDQNPRYRYILIDNLVKYSYLENDFNKSLEEQIE